MSARRSKILAPVGVKPQAAIYLLKSEFLLVADRDGVVEQKYIGPGAMRQAFAAEPIDSGWFPPSVRRWGVCAKGAWMLQFHEPAVRRVWMPGGKRQIKAPTPALAFFGIGSAYYIWAMKGGRFDPKGRLWNAPCANVNDLGLICWGQNPHPDVATGRIGQMWETFWDAPFSDSHRRGKSAQFPQDASARLADLSKRKVEKYPEDDMTPLKHRLLPNPTLDAAVELFTRRGDNSWEF